MGQRIIEVNGQSLLGATHQEAVNILRNAGDKIKLSVCDGFDPSLLQQVEGQKNHFSHMLILESLLPLSMTRAIFIISHLLIYLKKILSKLIQLYLYVVKSQV